MIDRHIGKNNTERRKWFEAELRYDLLGKALKDAKIKRNLTQEQLGYVIESLQTTLEMVLYRNDN
jgi:hypothetical protein